MYSIVVFIHVIISIFLIAVILLQAGRGSGLSDSFGGSQVQNLFGTKSTTILTRATSICAIGFIVTCLTLAVISSHRARSIVDNVKIPEASPISAPQNDAAETPANPPAPAEPMAQGEGTATE